MIETDQRSVWRGLNWRQAAWIPVPLLSLAVLVLSRFDVGGQMKPHALFSSLNVLFMGVVYVLIAFYSARIFLKKGLPAILFMGAGMLTFSLSCLSAGVLGALRGPAVAVSVLNMGALGAGLCHLGGAVFCGVRPAGEATWARLALGTLAVVVLFAGGVAWAAASGALPPLLDPTGHFPTFSRQFVLGTASGLFLASGLLYGILYERDRTLFVFWYCLGLVLSGTGLLSILMQRSTEDMLLHWAGRIGLSVGGLYVLLSLLHVLRKDRGLDMPLDAVLRESEGRYRALVDLVPDAVLAMRADRIVYVNKEAASLFRGSEEKLLEQKPDALMPLGEAGPIFQKARESLLQGRVARYEGDARTLKGTVVPVEARFSRIEWQGETAVLMAVRDVTERRRIEASMRESERRYRTLFGELSRSNRDLEQFASVSSHDLKEPLRMVTAFLSLLKERLEGCLDAQSEEYIRIAMTSATRMQALIDDLLVYSCVGREASAKAVSAAEAAALAVRNLEAVIQDSGAVIRVKALPAVKANAGELTQVFQNLISNAIKFRGLRSPDINVGVVRDGAFWRFSVRDNGIGIDPAYQDRLFKIFNRLHTPDEYPGTGVGLAVCKKIIERQGGRIWVESEPGTGATFHFTFPAMEPLP